MNCHDQEAKDAGRAGAGGGRKALWALAALIAAGAGYMLWSGRQQELVALLPFLLLLACPLMMVFMMRSHSGHGARDGSGCGEACARSPREPDGDGGSRAAER